MYFALKHSHMTLVAVSIILFNLRYWLLAKNPEKTLPKALKSLPHLNDSLLLFTGLWLMQVAHWTPFGNAVWLGWKLVLVVLYILLGMKALKAVPRSAAAKIFYLAAMVCVAVIVYLARFKPL
ncbi:MAG: SirB2 family protein [Neisseria sp.]|nr:SirB2 family protein [Neisseria sp.]